MMRALFWLVLVTSVAFLGGCRAMRAGADRGHRIIDRDGLPPAKLFGYAGACVGYTAGLPLAIALLPTYAFPRLTYPSSPDHDLRMPVLFAPLEIGGGLGAFLAAAPFWPFRPAREG